MRGLEGTTQASIVLLDACGVNPLAERLRTGMASSRNTRSAGVGRGLGRIDVGGNSLVVYSAAPNQEAEDGSGSNSPFTQALPNHIETPGLEVELMLKRVTAEVSRTTNNRQQPERLSQLKIEVMLKPGTSAATTPATATDAALMPPMEASKAQEPGLNLDEVVKARLDEAIRLRLEEQCRQDLEAKKQKEEQSRKEKELNLKEKEIARVKEERERVEDEIKKVKENAAKPSSIPEQAEPGQQDVPSRKVAAPAERSEAPRKKKEVRRKQEYHSPPPRYYNEGGGRVASPPAP